MHVFNRDKPFLKGDAAGQAFRDRSFARSGFAYNQNVAMFGNSQVKEFLNMPFRLEFQKLMLKRQ